MKGNFKMAYLRKNFKTLVNTSKEEIRANKLYDISAFLCTFEKYNSLFKENKAIELLKGYSEKVYSLKEEFTAKTVKYAENLLKFLNSFKSGKLDIDSVIALIDSNEWECFILGALQQLRKEFLFDEQQLQLT